MKWYRVFSIMLTNTVLLLFAANLVSYVALQLLQRFQVPGPLAKYGDDILTLVRRVAGDGS